MSKNKNPKCVNLIWADGLSKNDIEKLREMVDQAIDDPDYSLILNYELHWEKIRIKRNNTRIIWADGINSTDIKKLRNQIDMALVDPDFAIITNYEVHWNELD